MAFEISDGAGTPHATNYSDLLDKLITFLVGTGDWNLHNDQRGTVGEVTLRGEGLTGTENIYVGIKRYIDAINDIHGWLLQGYTGFTNAGFHTNPGAIASGSSIPALPLWNSTIPYWFFANARRFIVVAKVDNVYVSMYAGHILPYGSPGHWFYPLLIGGSNISNSTFSTHPRYSDTAFSMCSPFLSNSILGFSTGSSNICIRLADGTWLRLYNNIGNFLAPGGTSPTDNMQALHGVYPPVVGRGVLGGWGGNTSTNGFKQCRPNQAGDYPLVPLRLLNGNTPDALGIYDGISYIPGFGVTSQDEVTIGADEYIVFNDIFRTNLDSYFAIKKA